jgi:glutaredoxin
MDSWRPVQVEILTYAPTEFYHCQHCEIVWDSVGFGRRIRAEQRANALPADLQAEFTAISDWVTQAFDRYGERLVVKVVDVASLEGVIKSVRYGVRRFPAFIIDGKDRVVGFDIERLNDALERRFEGQASPVGGGLAQRR